MCCYRNWPLCRTSCRRLTHNCIFNRQLRIEVVDFFVTEYLGARISPSPPQALGHFCYLRANPHIFNTTSIHKTLFITSARILNFTKQIFSAGQRLFFQRFTALNTNVHLLRRHPTILIIAFIGIDQSYCSVLGMSLCEIEIMF